MRLKAAIIFRVSTWLWAVLGLSAGAWAQNAAPDGFEPLFNGSDLAGWHGQRDMNPAEWNSLDDRQRAEFLAADAADAALHWRAADGQIVNDGQGVFLTTDRHFGDYELLVDYKTVAGADSGIYLRGCPQVQIWDTTEAGGKWELGADKGSGGLWNNSPGAAGKDPLVHADRPFGQWNQVRVIQIGQRTSVWLNDQLVVDRALMESYWDRSKPLPATGPIQLQTHGGEICWRNIFVREIDPDEAARWLAADDSADWTTIFNGQDLTGWQGAVDSYEVVDGALRCRAGQGGTIFTTDRYGDFEVRFQFLLPPAGNNGLAIRYPGEGDAAYSGMCELQVLDSEHANYQGLDARQFHGSAYGMVAAQRGYLRPTGEWNFQHVTVRGTSIRVELNGSVILDCDLANVTDYLDGNDHPGKLATDGFFGFCGHGDAVAFRDVQVRRLTTPATPPTDE
jgi:hypothetical protein